MNNLVNRALVAEKKLFILFAAVLMAVGAMAQTKLTFHTGEEFKINGKCLQRIDMPEDDWNRTLVEEIYWEMGALKFVIFDNGRHITFHMDTEEGETLYTWEDGVNNPRYTFYYSPEADRKFSIKHQYRLTGYANNIIEFTQIQ